MSADELVGIWADLVIDGFAAAGVREVVVAPGSRSTPFALAALRHSKLRCHSVIDERSAAFFAVGQARITDAPTLVVATSGTAGAHFFPAVVEASASAIALLLLTADRPRELHDCGAPQTTDQLHLFGRFVRRFVDLGEPVAQEASLRAVHRRSAQAALTARGPLPGPVHINAPVAKPLEPRAPSSHAGQRLAEIAARIRDEVPVAAPPAPPIPSATCLDAVALDLATAERGLIFCGALPASVSHSEIHALARQTGIPLVAEVTSQLRFSAPGVGLCDTIEALMLSPEPGHTPQPDVVLQIGAAPLSPAWGPVLERARTHVLHPHLWADPSQSARSVAVGDVAQAVQALRDRIGAPSDVTQRARRSWGHALGLACRDAWRAVERTVEEAAPASLSEARIVQQVVSALPEGSALAVGNSLVVRELDRFTRAWTTPHPVVAQRGVNGIDGLVSAAAGVASVHAEVFLLLGDVSFVHDLGGLWSAARTSGCLVIVVVNNRGGRIFEQLPIRQAASPAELEFWTTPHRLDLGHAAKLFGIEFSRAATPTDLEAALAAARARCGCTLIEALVSPEDPVESLARLRRNLLEEVDATKLKALR